MIRLLFFLVQGTFWALYYMLVLIAIIVQAMVAAVTFLVKTIVELVSAHRP
jgi:hypothetical protein